MLKIAIFCLVLFEVEAYITSKDVLLEEFNLFKIQYRKTYKDKNEEQYRMKIFNENKLIIATHNQKYRKGLVTYEMGINKFGDLLHHEFVELMNGYKNNSVNPRKGTTYLSPSHVVVPDAIDWRTKGYVTPVKDQGECGSCYAFSATGALEGQHYRKTGKLVSLSEQNILDCSDDEGNSGCFGGTQAHAFYYIQLNHGIDTEEAYPYTGNGYNKCKFEKKDVGATLYDYQVVKQGNEEKLKEAIATQGPISVSIDASVYGFEHYKSGVYYEPSCHPDNLNHAVLAVGYGTDAVGGDYYIVKNSWGTDWGQQGYIWMARNKNNNCGIANDATFPLV
ncbi:hypothetical protein CHUAL_001834 [Chamberlinius hualienensis]